MTGRKFTTGYRVIGNEKKGSFWGRAGRIVEYEPRGQYWVQFGDGVLECADRHWLDHTERNDA